ncbi:MAG: tRNA (guanine37-N1) -methyltransferase [Parcubacteria group bacterium Gr01-1014_3]|nr:MAG: tRNA (guanine37-N1) -methyltransferase [Parcubacteria group bacterium Gr01-1014_3]
MKFDIITIFPKIFDSYFNESILKRAQEKRLIKITAHNLRDFAMDKHRKVDDKPYGGGPGMVLKVEPIFKAVEKLKVKSKKLKVRTILFSTRGEKLTSSVAKRLAKYDQLILICGRYEGVDERVAQYVADEEISIGDFVLAGGELPAMVLTEAVSRYIPGVLGKYESLEDIKGSYVSYTRPEVFVPKLKTKNLKLKTKVWSVPKVLITGHHKNIDKWRSGR